MDLYQEMEATFVKPSAGIRALVIGHDVDTNITRIKLNSVLNASRPR